MRSDTIAAIATSMGNSGIGIVRISGIDSIEIIDKCFAAAGGERMADSKSHTIHYGHIKDGDEIVDEVLVLIMKAPRSYTAEDTVEVDCHGGVFVLNKILETIIKAGARPAEPGEFTKRAFLNGRIDLSQAESVIDIINSQNEYALKSSLSQLSGSVSNEIKDIRSHLLHEIAFIESALDDPEHISLDNYSDKLLKVIEAENNRISKLLSQSENGRMIKEGISTVIVGKPNTGKSSFLNYLLGEERAIVTDIAGTTRDTLEEHISIDGIEFNFIDTAGIRDTENIVEKIGVEKAIQYINDADLVVFMVDGSRHLEDEDKRIAQILDNKKVVVILNKSDLDQVVYEDEVKGLFDNNTSHKIINISSKEKKGLEEFIRIVKEMFFNGEIKFNDEIYITNIRHKTALIEAQQSLMLVMKSIEDGMPEDFFTIDLMNSYSELGYIIGEEVDDDLVNEIFSKFCMGK
jgi:tRNA modification GTPase